MIVGVDVSSKRIDLAWLEDGRPQRWHQQLDPKAHLIDRLRSIRIKWPTGPIIHVNDDGLEYARSAWDVTDIAIEYPFGRGNAIAALMATVGVITRQAPPWARVAWPSSGELRQAIGAANRKADAHDAVRYLMRDGATYADQIPDWDEHELDALTACIGWTRILEANE